MYTWIFPGGSVVKNLPVKVGDPGSVLGLGWSPRGGHGNPLQYSCLENPTDRGAWQATVHGFTKSRTWLKQLSRSSSINTHTHISVHTHTCTHTHTHTHISLYMDRNKKIHITSLVLAYLISFPSILLLLCPHWSKAFVICLAVSFGECLKHFFFRYKISSSTGQVLLS